MSYTYLNLHPEGKRVGDCVKRALAKVFEKDYNYREISLILNRLKKVTKASTYNNKENFRYLLEKIGVERLPFPAVAGKKRMNGIMFTCVYPEGRYILEMAKHITAVVDGELFDTWDCSQKCVYVAWKIPENVSWEALKSFLP